MKTLPSDPFLRGYIVAALFTENPDPQSGEFTDDDAENLLDRVPESFLAEAARDCADFEASQAALLALAYSDTYDANRAGNDFWFSRNGHGVGFWDRGLEKVGKDLHAGTKPYGEHYLQLGGWWIQEYRCACGECWTRPEDADNDPDYGTDTCDKCGATVESLNRQQGEHLTACDEPVE